MTKLWRLLMATTFLSGAAGVGTAFAASNLVLPQQDQSAIMSTVLSNAAPVVLAQAVVDDKNNKKNKNNQQNTGQQNTGQQNTGQQNTGRQNTNQKTDKQNHDANRDAGKNNRQSGDNQNKIKSNEKPVTTQYSPPPDKNKNNDNTRNTDNKKNNTRSNPVTTSQPVTTTTTQTGGDKNKNKNNDKADRKDNGNRNAGTDNKKNDKGNADNKRAAPPSTPTTTTTQTGGGSKQTTTTTDPNIGTPNGTTTATDTSKILKSKGAGKGVTVETNDGKTLTNVNDIKSTRQVSKEGNKTVIKEVDRTIIKEGDKTIIKHDETARFRLGATNVNVQKAGADNRTIVFRPGGKRIVTLTDRNGFLLRRSIILVDGREIILINNRPRAGGYFIFLPPPRIRIPRERYIVLYRDAPPALLYDTLMAPPVDYVERAYTLDEIRYSPSLRDRMPRVDIDSVTFDSGSWELSPEQVDKLGPIADAMKRAIEQNPQVVFLVEGYTDAVGDENDNLSLSDRRAEAVAVALTEQFEVPAENLSTQGYGEQELKVQTDGPEEANRRVTVRNVAALLAGRGGPPQQN